MSNIMITISDPSQNKHSDKENIQQFKRNNIELMKTYLHEIDN